MHLPRVIIDDEYLYNGVPSTYAPVLSVFFLFFFFFFLDSKVALVRKDYYRSVEVSDLQLK